jgi:predicted AlkP superfamily phosphohydrolase/phosphomutase
MRVFVLGIDGLTFEILDPLIEKAILPNFARLKQEGAWGLLRSTVPPITPAAWMSIATGLKPAKHGVLDFLEVEWQDQQLKLTPLTRRKSGRAIWNILGDYNRRVGVVNVPCTYPPEAVNGLMVSGFSTPGLENSFTYPESFQKELFEVIPDYQIDISSQEGEVSKREGLLSQVEAMTAKRIKLLHYLLQKEAWDFIFFTFMGADRLQHAYWPELVAGERAEIFNCYRQIDQALARVMEWLGPEGLLIVVSDHGFRGTNRLCNINEVLSQVNLLKFSASARLKKTLAPLLRSLGLMNLGHLLYGTVRSPRETGALASERLVGSVKVEESQAWALAYARANYASLFLNPSTSNETAVKQALSQALTELIDRGITRAEDIFTGKRLEKALGGRNATMPEAVIIARSPWSFQGKQRLGTITEETEMVGIHEMEGCFLAWGSGVKAGYLIESATVFDVAPTILYACDLPMESDFDGQPLRDLFTFHRRLRIHDPVTGAIWEQGQNAGQVRKKLDALQGL